MSKITKAQEEAERLARDYIGRHGLGLEDDEVQADGTVTLHTSNRDERDIQDGYPNVDMRNGFAKHVEALRALSPLIYVFCKYVDEWVNLTVTIRSTPRKPRPSEIPKLVEKVIDGLPDEITQRPQVTHVWPHSYQGRSSGVEVRTNIPSPIGRWSAVLTWDLDGDTMNGWELVVQWGDHTARRPAEFKKLTPKIILAELARITAKLDDPLNCLGHTINVRGEDGCFLMTGNGQERRTYTNYNVTARGEAKIQMPDSWKVAVFTNNFTHEVTELHPGDPLPEHLKTIALL
jgi:hypothetical protein